MFHCYVYYLFHCYVYYLSVRWNLIRSVVEKDSISTQLKHGTAAAAEHANMYQPAAAALWTLTVLTQTVGMNHQPPMPGGQPQTPASHTPAAQQDPSSMGAGPHPGASQQTPSGGQVQTPTTSYQQQPLQQHCGPIHPADGWPTTHGGTFANTGPAIPWLPPWIANQHPNPAGGYTPMAATQFQWQATHPASNGAMVTSWGGYSLAPGATQYQTPQGQPAVVIPPSQNSMQMLPQPATYGRQHPPPMQSQQQQPQQATTRPTQSPPGLPQTFRPHQTPPTSQPHTYQAPPTTPQQSTYNTYPHATPPIAATGQPGTPGLWAREYDPDTDPAHPVGLPARAHPAAATTMGPARKPAAKPSLCQQPTLVADTRAGGKPASRVSHHPCSDIQAR